MIPIHRFLGSTGGVAVFIREAYWLRRRIRVEKEFVPEAKLIKIFYFGGQTRRSSSNVLNVEIVARDCVLSFAFTI